MPQSAEDASFRERIALMNSFYLSNQLNQQEAQQTSTARLSPSARQRLMSRQMQNGAIAPLDLAVGDGRVSKQAGTEAAHLSPVYENRMPPSPSTTRKQEPVASPVASASTPAWLPSKPVAKVETGKAARADVSRDAQHGRDHRPVEQSETDKVQKAQKVFANAAKPAPQRENGHVRGAKSEGDGGWQKAAGKGKKKGNNMAATQASHAELAPKDESERKGG
jgi:hypothetical protein